MDSLALKYLLASVQANGAQAQRRPFGTMVLHPTIKWPIFNWAVLEDESADLSLVRREFSSLGLPPSILAWSDSQESIATKLELVPHEVHWVLNAEARSVTLPETPKCEGLTVTQTSDVQSWLDTLLAGFEVPDQVVPRFHQAHSHIYQGDEHAHLYLARIGGKLAGAALLWISQGIAGIHTATVVPEFRGQGVYQALFKARVQQSLSMGVKKLATETAVSSVVHVASKFGFRPASCYRLWY